MGPQLIINLGLEFRSARVLLQPRQPLRERVVNYKTKVLQLTVRPVRVVIFETGK